ncbi:MAG: translocation/assembly module TamB domain-containing protein [Pleurocapsa sp.]
MGEVKGFSLGGIEFGKTTIPPTANDPDTVSVEGVKIGFNILPIIFRRTLPVDIALIQPDVYLEQEQSREWINLDFLPQDSESPIYFDVSLELENADITAVPYEQLPIAVKVDGSGRFNQKELFAAYNLDATINQAKATIQGETFIETGQTDTKLLVQDLALADFTTLLPNSPVILSSGRLNADLNVNIPSFEEIETANIKGIVSINNVTGQATNLSAPIKAQSELDFNGRNAQVKQTQASLGDIVARVDGSINLDRGYDLDVNVLPFELSSLPPEIIKQIPVNIGGEVEAALQLQGAIKEPLLTGNINNTQNIIVDKTPFKAITANFRADLNQAVLETLQIAPVAGGEVTAEGVIETKIGKALADKQQIDPAKMPLNFNFKAALPTQELVTPYYQLPPEVTVGRLNAEGKVSGTPETLQALVNWQIPEASTTEIKENISGEGELFLANNNLQLQNTQVRLGEGVADIEAEANLDNKNWQANLQANSFYLTPFLTQFSNPNLNLNRPVALQDAQIELNGKLDNLNPNAVTGVADLNLNVDGGQVLLDSKLNSGLITANVNTNKIPLQPFVNALPLPATINQGTIEVSGKLQQALSFAEKQNLDSFQVDADLDLDVDGNDVKVASQLNSGIIRGNVNTNQIDLNPIVAALSVPATVRSSQTNFRGELQQLLNFQENPNLSTFQANVDADLNVAEGTVKAIARLNNNQWQANVDAHNISSKVLLNTFAPNNLAVIDTDNINAQIDVSGDINPLINNQVNIPIAINSAAVQAGEQNVNAQGNLTLSNITTNLDLANTNLNVNANIDFDRLPIKQIMAATTENNQLVADSINFTGQAKFDGQFNGKNLISAPTQPGNVALTGDLQLLDFAFNDVDFAPVMSGTVNVRPESEIALNLTGQQDVIAASLVPCNTDNCRLPYLPNNLQLRQGEDSPQPVVVIGNRDQDTFSLDINNFPLALLNLAPAKAAGIEGALTGKTTGNINLNLFTLATNGEVAIEQPGIGYIKADKLAADFNYDPSNNVAEVTTASLNLRQSKYSLNAGLDLQTGAINGRLNIPEAYIQDLLQTLRWFTVEDLIELFNRPDYTTAAAVKPTPEKDTVGESIAEKLYRLRQVETRIQQIAAKREAGSIPTELDIQGKYSGLITFGGTLQQPKANFRVEANNWRWQPQKRFVNVIDGVGLVKDEAEIINIPQLLIAGNLQGTVVDLAIAKLQLEDSIFSASGTLSPETENVNFQVANLTIDTISKFVEIPVDLAGAINAEGTLTGTPNNPQLAGNVAFVDGLYNGNPLPNEFAGNFDYNGTRLQFETTKPSSIQASATVPYPIIPGQSDRLDAEIKLDNEAFSLLGTFSQGYLDWMGGMGDADIQATALLDLNRATPIYDLNATGVINLDNAQVNLKTPFFAAPFQGTGKITLNNQIVTVETLEGTFAEKDLSVQGALPILTAVNNLNNPLTVNLPEGEIDINELYQGGLSGNITVQGAALKPIVGGEVNLKDGKVSIPQVEEVNTENAVKSVTQNKNVQTTPATKNSQPSPFITYLDNFQVNLTDFKLEQSPLYEFSLNGDLLLNGSVDQPSNIKPQGTLTLKQGRVDWLSNNFDLNRTRENTIVFTPQAGILNPYLDIQLNTEINDFDQSDRRVADSEANELSDPISQGSDSDLITVNLPINGEAEEILPNLAQKTNNCTIRPNNTSLIEANQFYTKAELNRLTNCFNAGALIEEQESNLFLLDSPAVELTSTPSRSQGEIISLLGNTFLSFADRLQNSSQSELFDLGVNRFVIDPLRRRIFSTLDDKVINAGKSIGLDYLRIYPRLEGIYEINRGSSVRSSYNYGFQDSHEVRIEYQRRF